LLEQLARALVDLLDDVGLDELVSARSMHSRKVPAFSFVTIRSAVSAKSLSTSMARTRSLARTGVGSFVRSPMWPHFSHFPMSVTTTSPFAIRSSVSTCLGSFDAASDFTMLGLGPERPGFPPLLPGMPPERSAPFPFGRGTRTGICAVPGGGFFRPFFLSPLLLAIAAPLEAIPRTGNPCSGSGARVAVGFGWQAANIAERTASWHIA
jgi:hypothetical protein